MNNTTKKRKTYETYTHYPDRKPDELTLQSDGIKVTVSEKDLPMSRIRQAGEVPAEVTRQRLRLEAERKMAESTGSGSSTSNDDNVSDD